jgi:L,D-transpeptidase catalytic domain/Putative peptidoglycan binding domain
MRVALAGILVLLALAPGAVAQLPPPPPPEPERIAAGVTVAGVDVSGMTVEEAQERLRAELVPRVREPIAVRVAGRRFQLSMRRLRLRLDVERSARRALRAGRRDAPPVAVRPVLSFRRKAIRRFVLELRDRVYVAPRNATLTITLRRMIRRRSYGGRKLNEQELGRRLLKVVREPQRPRRVRGTRRRVEAPVTWGDLERLYPTVVTIDRAGFRLRLFKRLRYDRSYPVAVGLPGYDTPTGFFRIVQKQVDPPWHAPNRPWAGSYAGTTVPGGAPDNPLKARWLGVTGSVGIHGTADSWSVGTRASHGCIRMLIPDVIDLYDRVPLGTPVLIR